MLIKKFFLILFILFLFNSFDLFSDITEARAAYKNGNITESINLYDNWLQQNHESKDFTSILFELTELNGDIDSITTILEEQIEFVSDRNKKKKLFICLAQINELSSDLHNAQINYQNAALITLNKIDYELLLKSAEYLLFEGDLFLAKSQMEEIISKTNKSNILLEAELFYEILNILHFKNNSNNLSSIETPESLYLLYLIAKANSKPLEINSIEEDIIRKFECSPEAKLIKNKILEIPNILSSLGLLITKDEEIIKPGPDKNFMIQTGSFTDEENAYYLSKDLNLAGFKSLVEKQTVNDIIYYKVMLYFPSETLMISALKDLQKKGFEGFPIY